MLTAKATVSSDPVARDGTGDDEEHRDEVLAVSVTRYSLKNQGMM